MSATTGDPLDESFSLSDGVADTPALTVAPLRQLPGSRALEHG